MLQEAITRVLTGSRRCADRVTMVAFVAGILRSLRADYWRRVQRESRGEGSRFSRENDDTGALDIVDPAPGPERATEARHQVALIKLLFADDPTALKIIEAMCNGLSAEQIRISAGLSRTEYDSARRRMRRAVLREGLTCEPK
jgi:DNA-directed RNA polymerase specialized sigma24 family protein